LIPEQADYFKTSEFTKKIPSKISVLSHIFILKILLLCTERGLQHFRYLPNYIYHLNRK